MALGSQLPIRLEPDVERRLESAAQAVGTTKSALIRMLAKTFVDKCYHPDGSVTLPPNWEELLSSSDARAKRVKLERREGGPQRDPSVEASQAVKKAGAKIASKARSPRESGPHIPPR